MFKPRKVGWSNQGRTGLREGVGDRVKYLKRGGTEKRGGETKNLKRVGKLGQGGGASKKKGGLEPP